MKTINLKRINKKMTNILTIALFAGIMSSCDASDDNNVANFEAHTTTYEMRREAGFAMLKGKPLERVEVQEPVFEGGANYSRLFSYALIDYAFKCFWLGENIEGANAALLENANYYIGYPRAYSDPDSFYWSADQLCRIIEFYGDKGSKQAGLLKPHVEERMLLMMWQYSKQQSQIAKADFSVSKTWNIEGSENHDVQMFTTAWHFAKLLKDHPDYRDKRYDDGYVAAQHYEAWSKYIAEWIKERARKGLFVEMCNDDYNLLSLKGLYNIYDFGSKELSHLTENLLNLFWTAWAQEQKGAIWGGAKSRYYPVNAHSGRLLCYRMGWYYFGLGMMNPPYQNLFTLITSDFRPDPIVEQIALNASKTNTYEVYQRRVGLAQPGFHAGGNEPYKLITDRGLLRYTYNTPEYMAGTFMSEALSFEKWTLISSQNRWAGVIFEGNPDSRIYAVCKTGSDSRAYNQFWCVQKKGAMIFQRLPDDTHCKNGYDMMIWISRLGITDFTEREGWVFYKAPKAYVAIKAIDSEYKMEGVNYGRTYTPKNWYAPIVVEVAASSNFKNYEDFQNKIIAHQCEISGNRAFYESFDGHLISLPTNYEGLPQIDGQDVEINPEAGMSSPFLNTQYDSGKVDITYGDMKKTLDF